MEAARSRPTASLVLETASHAPIEALVVRRGDSFGPDGRYVNEGTMPIVEFRRLDVGPRIAHLSAYWSSLFELIALDVRFAPDGSLPLALPIAEVRRLVAWLSSLGVIERTVDELG